MLLGRRRRPGCSGRRHSQARDAQAIAHHYNVSNRFYELVLGPSMAYTCAVYPTAESTLEEAQWAKHDLVARKLGLEPGMRLLDVGCGWGGMVRHAAKEYGVKALGVTLSQAQAEYAQKRIADEGLSDLAEVRFLDYRKVDESGFDAVSAIGLAEHIGRAQMPAYFASIHEKVKPWRAFPQPLHHPAALDRPGDRQGRLHRPLRLPRRRAVRSRARWRRTCRTPASRCATSRTCASTTG